LEVTCAWGIGTSTAPDFPKRSIERLNFRADSNEFSRQAHHFVTQSRHGKEKEVDEDGEAAKDVAVSDVQNGIFNARTARASRTMPAPEVKEGTVMREWITNVLLAVLIGMVFMLNRQQPRFQSAGDVMVLDTKTGQLCSGAPGNKYLPNCWERR
jgi:hypothetical protein